MAHFAVAGAFTAFLVAAREILKWLVSESPIRLGEVNSTGVSVNRTASFGAQVLSFPIDISSPPPARILTAFATAIHIVRTEYKYYSQRKGPENRKMADAHLAQLNALQHAQATFLRGPLPQPQPSNRSSGHQQNGKGKGKRRG